MPTLLESFWDHVDRSGGADACWPWTRARIPSGYGSVRVGDGQRGAHRVAYELAHGPIAEGNVVRHACDNPPCCNPAHLSEGSYRENLQDCIDRGRRGDTTPHRPERGAARYNAKLTDAAVAELREDRRVGMKWREIAEKYGVAMPTARRACSGASWRHVTTRSC